MAGITCTLCGGTNFYKESGFYYCNECQTQSQEIREHVFAVAEEDVVIQRTSTKKIQKVKKTEDKLTSWECYNYILFGLVNELIELGASEKLKTVVHTLWFKYLQKLEVVTGKTEQSPKLSAVNCKTDAEIIYGRSVKRKRRSKSRTPSPVSSNTSGMDSSVLRREKAKQRRSLILAEYDEFRSKLQNEEASLHNQSLHSQTLQSLKSSSDASQQDKYLKFNRIARKEILKVMTKNHLKTHCRDVDSSLECHNLSYRTLSNKYVSGATVLTRSKIYALIYLGLLIIKDKIQLSDLIRYVREGHLSFHVVDHFFPETYSKSNLNIKTWNEGSRLLSHSRIRILAATVAKYLGVTKYIPRQNLIELCQRYCLELNLPDEVWGYTVNLISRALPKLRMTKHSSIIPNYEGRTMGMIIFVLKLLFGLDDVTENKFSTYANNLNVEKFSEQKMFVWNDWVRYINYRKLVIAQHHYPTQHLYDPDNTLNSDIFVSFIEKHNLKYEKSETLKRQGEVLQQLLEKIKDEQTQLPQIPDFLPSLTPFCSYTKELLTCNIPKQNNYFEEILSQNFKRYSLTFLTNPLEYLGELNKTTKVGIKHRGANKNLTLINYQNMKCKREAWRHHVQHTVAVKVTSKSESHNPNFITPSKVTGLKLEESTVKLDSQKILKGFENEHSPSYKSNLKKSLKQHQSLNSDSFLSNSSFFSQSSKHKVKKHIHYNAYERYWLRSMNVQAINIDDFSQFLMSFPYSFRMLLEECARVTEQSLRDMLDEFTNVEIYLCYVANFTTSDKDRDVVTDKNLTKLINKAVKNW